MKRIFVLMLLAGVAAAISGCTVRLMDFTVMSTKNIPCDFAPRGTGEGEDISHIIIFVPTKSQPNLKEAMDEAIESRAGDTLMNAKIYYRYWYIPLIYGQDGWTVKGDVVSTRD
ncbi:MAG: hypothetical protein NTX50_03885 [Candidatus Sumerlaeota bacterium]|nr:hypothetical protein [Candidatus Sumerlaeota bacterium]